MKPYRLTDYELEGLTLHLEQYLEKDRGGAGTDRVETIPHGQARIFEPVYDLASDELGRPYGTLTVYRFDHSEPHGFSWGIKCERLGSNSPALCFFLKGRTVYSGISIETAEPADYIGYRRFYSATTYAMIGLHD